MAQRAWRSYTAS